LVLRTIDAPSAPLASAVSSSCSFTAAMFALWI
jgi:hypothetical protein